MNFFNRKLLLRVASPQGQTISIDEKFRVVFNVTKSSGTEANSAQIMIYGLSKETREKMLKPELAIFLEAGYGSQTELLFAGSIIRAFVSREPPEIVTKIEAGSGVFQVHDLKVSLSFTEGTPVTVALTTVAAQLGLPVIFSSPLAGVYLNGFSVSGPLSEALNKLSKKGDFVWSIQDNEIHIKKRGESIPARAVVLSEATGLLNSPQRLDDKMRFEITGYQIESFMQPKIRPNTIIQLLAKDVRGVFRVENVEYRGDTFGNEWVTIAEVYDA